MWHVCDVDAENWPKVLGTLLMVAVITLPPALLSVTLALRIAMPNSMSLMFPMMLPLADCGPPGRHRDSTFENTASGTDTEPGMGRESNLDRPERYSATAERRLLDKHVPHCSETDCYRDGRESSRRHRRKLSTRPTAAMSPSCRRLKWKTHVDTFSWEGYGVKWHSGLESHYYRNISRGNGPFMFSCRLILTQNEKKENTFP